MKEIKKFRATETISSCTLDFGNGKKTMKTNTKTISKLGKEYGDNEAFVGYVKPSTGKTPRSWFGVRANNAGKHTSRDFRNGAHTKDGYTATLVNADKSNAYIVYTPVHRTEDISQNVKNAKKSAEIMTKEMELGNI